MAWTKQTSNIVLTNSTLGLSATSGDLMIVGHRFTDASSNPTIADNQGGAAWVQIGSTIRDAGAGTSFIWWWKIANATDTFFIDISNTTATYLTGGITFRNGTLQATPLHASNGLAPDSGTNGGSTATDGVTSGTFAATAGDLIVSMVTSAGIPTTANWAAHGTGFTTDFGAYVMDGSFPVFGTEYILSAAGGTPAGTWTTPDTLTPLCVGASFTAQGGAATATLKSSLMLQGVGA